MADLFPIGLVEPIVEVFERVLNDDTNQYTVVRRPMSEIDKSRTVAVFPTDMTSNPDSKLIGSRFAEPYENFYKMRIENIFIGADEPEARRQFSIDAKSIRAILYRDTTFRVSLAALQEDFMGSTETVSKYDVLKQEYMGGRSTRGFQFMAVTELAITTEQRS